MLYTFSQATYDKQELEKYIASTEESDAILCWLDGIVALQKYATIFEVAKCPVYLLNIDCEARNINNEVIDNIAKIELSELVELTSKYFPQIAL